MGEDKHGEKADDKPEEKDEPIDRVDLARGQRKWAERAAGYAASATLLSTVRGVDRGAVTILEVAAKLSRDFSSELGCLLGEIPF